MPEGQVLEFTHVTKRFNEVTAVSDFSARVEPGAVTAFLGPNGAGKTTTLRILLGQVRATSGTATIGGTAYAELRQPLRTIGAVLEETVYRPRRTAERQLTIAAKANGIPLARVGEVLSLVGLEGEGDSRIGGFSLGMRQRLSVAHALLGDPGALVFDEPANGLDPEGIRWMRLLMRRLADEGRTVLVSSHVLSEVEQVADNVLVLSKGKLLLASGIETLADPKGGSVIVDAADRGALTTALSAAGFDIEVLRSGLTVRGGDAGTVGAVAAEAGIALSTLVQRGPTLEDVFIDLMRGGRLMPSVEAATAQPVAAAPSDGETTAPAPVDSVVAIPVAAAAAWAADAAAAPADEAVADDLAASVGTGSTDDGSADADSADADSADADSADADSADADSAADDSADADSAADDSATEESTPEAPTEDAPADAPAEETGEGVADGSVSDGGQVDETLAEDAAAVRSFDEILFGSAAPVSAVPTTSDETDDESSADAVSDDDHTGVEIFSELDETAGSGGEDVSDADESGAEDDASDGEEDPRSAAVSSMLAAAARAYYEDEPKDYPLRADNRTSDRGASDDVTPEEGASEEGTSEEGTSEEGAHWTVASTGVIGTVAESTDSGVEESGTDESGTEESGADESATDESGTDEPVAEDAGTDEPVTDEAVTEEAGTDESVTDEESGDTEDRDGDDREHGDSGEHLDGEAGEGADDGSDHGRHEDEQHRDGENHHG